MVLCVWIVGTVHGAEKVSESHLRRAIGRLSFPISQFEARMKRMKHVLQHCDLILDDNIFPHHHFGVFYLPVLCCSISACQTGSVVFRFYTFQDLFHLLFFLRFKTLLQQGFRKRLLLKSKIKSQKIT